ncbi:MAG TPA: branched-chain amino acid ABC transporter permease [Candidatus Limnocylindria bacterium]|nr:branched-chain amino acid ABC transporter permease [Candidatus Limnocylindria bacterium]
MLLAQQVLNGATIGIMYALAAVGLTLTFGILRVINFAHGEFYMLGAFVTYTLLVVAEIPYVQAVVLAVLTACALGLLAERLTVRPLRGRHHFTVVLATLGLSVFLQNGALAVWGPDPREIALPWDGAMLLGGLIISRMRLVALAAGVVLIAALTLFIRYTRVGMAMRAVARNPDAAALMGVNVPRIYGLTFSMGAGLAAVSGGLLGAIFTIEPTMGEWAVIKAFSVVIMGGLGSVPGAVAGGLLLGVAESLSVGYLPGGVGYRDGIAYAMIILVLLLRPQGLFGQRV